MSTSFTFGQTVDWTKGTSNIRDTEVKSNISEQTDPNGNKIQTIEYIATTITDADFNACIAVMKNTALHKNIFDYTAKSELLEKVSETEWYNYYYTDMPWPMSNSDSATRFLFSNNGQTASFKSNASPDKIDDKGVKRMSHFQTDYLFTKLENGKVKITIKSKFQPVSNAPKWLLNFWFPDGPARMIDRLVRLSEQKK